MHKSWGNAIDFDEAAERMGVDVMRWMFAKARPEENILFGWHAADEARRELLVLWNVYAFFVTYARLAGWTPGARPRRPVAERPALDRWILSRAAGDGRDRSRTGCATSTRSGATRALSAFLDGLSTWYLRRSRDGASRDPTTPRDRAAAFATLHAALVATTRMLAPILPFLAEAMYENLVATVDDAAPDSVHLTRWPTAELAAHRDARPRGARWTSPSGAVDLARTLRSANRPQDAPAAGAGVARGTRRRRGARPRTCSTSSRPRST